MPSWLWSLTAVRFGSGEPGAYLAENFGEVEISWGGGDEGLPGDGGRGMGAAAPEGGRGEGRVALRLLDGKDGSVRVERAWNLRDLDMAASSSSSGPGGAAAAPTDRGGSTTPEGGQQQQQNFKPTWSEKERETCPPIGGEPSTVHVAATTVLFLLVVLIILLAKPLLLLFVLVCTLRRLAFLPNAVAASSKATGATGEAPEGHRETARRNGKRQKKTGNSKARKKATAGADEATIQ